MTGEFSQRLHAVSTQRGQSFRDRTIKCLGPTVWVQAARRADMTAKQSRGAFISVFASIAVTLLSGAAGASPAIEGWWVGEGGELTVNGAPFDFGEAWYVVTKGRSACAIQSTSFGGRLTHIRAWDGAVDGGKVTVHRGTIIRGEFADALELASVASSAHLFMGSGNLVLKFEYTKYEPGRLDVLERHVASPPADVLAALRHCKFPAAPRLRAM